MDWLEALKDVNYWAVLVAVASGFVVGMIWYSMKLFGKTWMKEAGLKDKDVQDKDSMMRAMGIAAVSSLFSAATLGALLLATGTEGAVESAAFGVVIGFAFPAMALAMHDGFTRHSFTLSAINGAHDIVKFAVIGAILGGLA